MDGRLIYISERVAECLGLEREQTDRFLNREKTAVFEFFSTPGPQTLLVSYQVPEEQTPEGEWIKRGTTPTLIISNCLSHRLHGRACYFLHNCTKPVTEKTANDEIQVGTIKGHALTALKTIVNDFFSPMLRKQEKWGRLTADLQVELLKRISAFGSTLTEAAESLANGVELTKPDVKFTSMPMTLAAFKDAAEKPESAKEFSRCLQSWISQVERLLADNDCGAGNGEDGPMTELFFWRQRMAKFNSVTQQLKAKECRMVLGVCNAAKTPEQKVWKELDLRLTDAANESKDNVKFLSTLEKTLEPMYEGSPQDIIDGLPALMDNIRMMHTIARYYSTAERMTTLFIKITNQMITKCKEHINPDVRKPEKLWKLPKPELIESMQVAINLADAYEKAFEHTRRQLMAHPKGKQFDFDKDRIFEKFNLFKRRLEKLVDMFRTIHQFSSLEAHTHIEGLSEMIANFNTITDNVRMKGLDLLDFYSTQLDRDYLEFNVNIHDLEMGLQTFINKSFERISSTEQALSLLRQIHGIMQRDSLRGDLEAKYLIIFQHYGLDMDAVQKTYEKHKYNPPVPRNAPPVAGNIMWARQLLRRIEMPMRQFEQVKSIMGTKESRRTIKTYNRLLRTLLEFEALWHQAWLMSAESVRAGLSATLLVRHPNTGQLLVNFGKDIAKLVKEARCMKQMGIAIPPIAQTVLLQEHKFNHYYQRLSHVVAEHARIMGSLRSIVKPLLKPHIADLEQKLAPGLTVLSWMSLNIDGFIHLLTQALARFEELVNKVNDMLTNRVESNLALISRMLLINLPADQSFSYEEFGMMQARFISRQGTAISVRNQEVRRSVQELLQLIRTTPRENPEVKIDRDAAANFNDHFYLRMYGAIAAAMRNSFAVLKERVAPSLGGDGAAPPFFDVEVDLKVPDVVVSPSLDEIQEAVNTCAKKVLTVTKDLRPWAVDQSMGSFWDMLSHDLDIVKSVLLLKGTIDTAKETVRAYIEMFSEFSFLWLESLNDQYERFVAGEPSMEDFEKKLQEYAGVELRLHAVSPAEHIGPLCISTAPIKACLLGEAASWKQQFAQKLHKEGADKLHSFDLYVRETTRKLSGKVEDLEDVRTMMDVLQEVRDKEANIDNLVNPIEDMYALLLRYAVAVPKEESDLVSDLHYSWKKLRKLATDVSNKLAHLQAGFKRELIKQVNVFVVEARSFKDNWDAEGPTVPNLDPMDAADRLRKFKQTFEVNKSKWDNYASGEELFGLHVTRYPELEDIQDKIQNLDKLYSLYVHVIQTIQGYGDVLWTDVVSNIEDMTAAVNSFQARAKTLPKALRDWPAYRDCRTTIDDFLELLPLVQALTDPSVCDRHWIELQSLTGAEIPYQQEDAFKLQHLLDAKLLTKRDDVEDLAGAAVKEKQIERKLESLRAEWAVQDIKFMEHKNRGAVVIKPADYAELVEKLEESQMNLSSMATNRYSKPFEADVQEWLKKLGTVSEIMEQWFQVQNVWTYMEAVFSGGDIVKQLPTEAKRFQNIDKNFMKIVQMAAETGNIVDVCNNIELIKTMLPHLQEQLDLCQKSLSAYLETKRGEFPRFYFVSDPTLLEILSLGSHPPSVVPHFMSGLFDSMADVKFDEADSSKITHMYSPQREEVEMDYPVDTKGNIEVWLQRLVDGMKDTVCAIIKAANRNVYNQELEAFIFGHPAQIALLGIQFMWTADTQAALTNAKTDKSIMSKNMKKTDAVLKEMVTITVKTSLSSIQRTNLETCITVHMHQKESTEDLVKKKVKDPTDFEWLKQARFYWREDRNTVIISICDVDFQYSFEYLGVKERLVITPLTDICYVTLSQALGMFLGGAPAGPAGTGKTETTKDLGNTLGKYVVVFNCSDQMDYIGMGKIYKGLAQSGLWGCFDEFNRINLDVLSVCAQQVYCVLSAIRERKKQFTFTDGSVVDLDDRVGFFITMNPGYAGRQELPENLKALFRGVTMMVPNRQIIMKVKLAACGYQENDIISKKFFVLYGLCEQQLSKQAHYDFGLRNILSVLRTGGASKRSSPDKSEIFLMMRTLRDMNMSKFVAEDVPLFMSLIKDLFPGLEAERASFPDVEKALHEQILERGLQAHPTWVNKCIQLYETYLVRHGIMLVGPSGGGKSAIEECVAAALSVVLSKHQIWRMNPKAITAPQMFGRLDPATGDWTDGVFAELWRRAAKTKDKNTWIVLDGPVDAIWIENLNTVLDDNKVLTLANGDRIIMSPLMKAMFEPENLANASPATVSRAGIIYVSDVELGWLPPVVSWLDRKPAALKEILLPLFEKYIDPLLLSLRMQYRPLVYNETACTLAAMRTLMDGCGLGGDGAAAMPAMTVQRLFVYCLTWSLGGLLDQKDRPAFDADVRTLGGPELPPKGGDGEDATVFEWTVNDEGEWQHWSGLVPTWTYPRKSEKPKFAQLNIPTLDSTRYDALLTRVASVRKSSLLVGGPGTAKTTIINMFIAKFPVEEVANKVITFSSLTTPGIFQTTMEAAVEKRQGRTFGPPGGKKMTVFIDDISMPYINEWGDQVTNEIVRQLLEQNGFYSTEKPIGDMKFIVDCDYLGAMNTPGGGKNDVPHRLKRQFNLYYVPLPSKASINNVYGALVEGRFTAELFDPDTIDLSSRLVPMTIALWNKVQVKMLPTPAKFHYLFNMRELSKVFQGIILASRDRFTKDTEGGAYAGNVTTAAGYLLSLWLHECRRVFADKLTSHEDKEWVDDTVMKLISENCGQDLVSQVEEPVYFVDFLREPEMDEETGEVVDAHPSFYEGVTQGLPEVRTRVEALQAKFNEESRVYKLELVLFTDALLHLMRIARLLAMDRGSALLVGVGGSGKQSLSRLAAYIRGAFTFQITITKSYNVTNLFEDIKGLYKIAAVKGQPVVFIFTDAEVKDEGFLEYINQILMTGEVAGLMPKDELDAMVNDMRPIMKQAIQRGDIPAQPDTYENLYTYYLNRVRDNLHLVLCFSPVGAKFARRAMQFPGLINGCTIDWFLPWPEEALTSVSGKFIAAFDMACTPLVKDSLKLVMGHVHVFVTAACQEYFEKFRRHAYVTPKSFLSFIQFYMNLYKVKWEGVAQLAQAINAGLEKMDEAKVDVGRMKANLAVKNQELAKASKEAEALLKSISESTAIAEKEKNKVAVIVDGVTAKAAEIAGVKADAEKDLAAAQPALDAAVSALNSITPKDIGALKALKNPPDIVKRIFDCVLLLRMYPLDKPSWHEVKGNNVIMGAYETSVKMMSDSQFLSHLMNFPKEQINDETVELLQPYFLAPDFNFESAAKASGNVAGLCNWANAMCSYHNVAVVVEPKIQALREAEAELKIANKEKAAAEERMAVVQAKLDEAQAEFDKAMAHKQALEDDAAATQKKMDSANALIGALAGEEARWSAQSKEFDQTIQQLTGDCCIASAFVSYLGPFNKEFRDLLIKRDFFSDCKDNDVPVTQNMNLTSFLVDDATVGEWNLQGLPTDDLSIQNGIMVNNAARYPVLVDPQGQARTWILNKEHCNELRVTQLNDRMFRMALEDCLSTGKPLLIENIEEDLDPVLDPVLEKRVIKKGRSYILPLADKEVDFDPNFKLFCTTRLPNPHYTPELSAKVTLIDFTVTMVGLEDQLLGKLIGKEKGELEEQRQALIEEVQNYKKKIKQLEDDLLDRLSNSTGNLLDDTELIDVLATTKHTAQEVAEKLNNASETNSKITEACEEYRPVAHRATLLYFIIAEFSVVNCMYQTSLAQFTQLYELAIDKSEQATLPSKRIQNIIDHLTYEIYLYIQRGLFERHKLLFALMLTNRVMQSAGSIRAADVDVFLKGGGALDIMSVRKKPKEWIPDSVWLSTIALSQMDAFRDIPDSVFRNDGLWKQWYDQEAPEMAKVPEYEDRLSKFERMCVVKTFREDRTLVAASEYVADSLGQKFVESVPLNMERAWAESHKRCPLICLLSRGSDPTKLIEDLAKRKKIKVLGVSMGQGQEIIARKYMATAAQEGQWVLLQNTHLGLNYLTEVETYLTKEADSIHEEFRLWITAEPHPAFPIGLLQMGIKITNEAPVGIKAGLRASFQWVSQDMLDAVSRFEWRQLLFIQCYIHSIVQERRKFGPIGWNIPYEFNASDLSACTQFLQNHTLEMEAKKAPEPNWSTVRYMVSQIQYGGKITDDFDMLLMDTYVEKFFHSAAMKVNYELYRDERSGQPYNVPEGNDIDVFRGYIETLAAQESPEIFGLHPNADLTFRTLQVQDAVVTILDTMPKGGGGGGTMSREDIVDKICEELLAKCPPAFDKEEVKDKANKLPGGATMPLTVTLRQEIDCLNIVIKLTKNTLGNLRLAIAGSVALSGDLIDALDALFNARIPASWLKKSWEAATLGNWFTGLLQRFDQLSKWINTGRPRSYWLTGFFNPQGFLTAMKQEVNRRHAADKWALDDVVMTSTVTHPARDFESLKDTPAEGVYVHGLFLDGAAWSKSGNRLTDAEPKELYNPLPVLHVTGVQARDKPKKDIFECPAYRVKKRTGLNFITTFALRTEDPKSKWVLRGTALLCSKD